VYVGDGGRVGAVVGSGSIVGVKEGVTTVVGERVEVGVGAGEVLHPQMRIPSKPNKNVIFFIVYTSSSVPA
jgi:hypothetical protein